jgi:hypothetical protein
MESFSCGLRRNLEAAVTVTIPKLRLTPAPSASNFIAMFELVSDYAPAGDQPQAIAKLTEGILPSRNNQSS